jgi:hypothetical protein
VLSLRPLVSFATCAEVVDHDIDIVVGYTVQG